MKILLVHNSYQQPGGEDVVFRQEQELLERTGHQVLTYCRSNSEISSYSALKRILLAGRVVWAIDTQREISSLLQREKPDIVHLHNTFLMVSPSVYAACRKARIPVVQTLHNYRLLCPAAVLFRAGHLCEECIGHSLWHGIRHGCYRDSHAGTFVVASMLAVHRLLHTWTLGVNCFIALSEFSRKKFIEGGIPPEKVIVKPNFVYPDPGYRAKNREYALFVGRLSPEKRVLILLDVWKRLRKRIPLLIIGGGSQRAFLEARAKQMNLSDVHFLGQLQRHEVIASLKSALFLMFTSEWYETFGMTIVEAFACGVPVLASRMGVMKEIVEDERTGFLFTPGDPADLAARVDWALTHPEEMEGMGREARNEYLAKYTAERNYQVLLEIYQQTIETNYRS